MSGQFSHKKSIISQQNDSNKAKGEEAVVNRPVPIFSAAYKSAAPSVGQ